MFNHAPLFDPGYTEHMSSSHWNPRSRFQRLHVDWDIPPPPPKLVVIEERPKTILRENNSPDLPFRWSLNPYRGCTHACAYCYARAFHEYLDMGAGSDFERKIVIKPTAATQLRERFQNTSWKGDRIVFSGVTDCYQPIERKHELTRACLEVCAEYRNPIGIITRSPLILRDIEILQQMARHDAVEVHISIPILDERLARVIEPGAPPPSARLQTIRHLADAGVPVGISMAPILPGINDHAIPATLEAAKDAGAMWAWTQLVRLSDPVAQVFENRLRSSLPHRADAIMARIRRARGGKLNERDWHRRMRGVDATWSMAETVFEQWKSRLDLKARPSGPTINPFRRPNQGAQLNLFASSPKR